MRTGVYPVVPSYAIVCNDTATVTRRRGDGYGQVKLAYWPARDTSFALKLMSKKHILKKQQAQHVAQERHLLGMCNHPFLMRLCGAFQDPAYLYLLFEIIQGGELFTVISDINDGTRERLSERDVAFYAANVACGLEYLHEYYIAYRDLKPENLLIDKHGYLKIVDFGFAKIVSPHQRTWTICGTPEYLAPEVILRRGHNFVVDWWCVGVLTYELAHLRSPFVASNEFRMCVYVNCVCETTYRTYMRRMEVCCCPFRVPVHVRAQWIVLGGIRAESKRPILE